MKIYAWCIVTALATGLAASDCAATMDGSGSRMGGVFDREISSGSASLYIIPVDPSEGRFFAAINVRDGDCVGAITGTTLAGSKMTMVIQPAPGADPAKACFVNIGLNKVMDTAMVLETTQCSRWHGDKCSFEGVYHRVHS